MAIIPAEVGVCSWNSTARRHPMDAAAAILKNMQKINLFYIHIGSPQDHSKDIHSSIYSCKSK